MTTRGARALLVALLIAAVALAPRSAFATGTPHLDVRLAQLPGPDTDRDTLASPPATGEPTVPAPTGFVNDAAGALDETTRAKLEAFLDQVKRKTGAEFAVLVMRTTAPLTPTEYKTRVFDAWKIGQGDSDEGLLMLVALEEREVRFETGYGLEGVLPDGLQSRIFRRTMAPRFQQGDVAGAVIAGVQEIAARIAAEKGVTLEWDGRQLRYDRSNSTRSGSSWLPIVVGLLIVFVAMRAQSSRRGWRRRSGGWGDWGGGMGGWGGGFGGGGFGGGFGGGGGSFGGGGGSFGGFGGGSSGGGGGGGKW